MCGFVGFLHGDWSAGPDAMAALASAMGDRIAHRGPDRSSRWIDAASTIALSHARLAIVDLSSAGNQPMESDGGRYVIVYNGEIYNHLDVRRELEGAGLAPPWRGHSDTETLLAGIEAWGVSDTLRRCVGMFAFGLWDRKERDLFLARDRAGEKPLYYGWQGQGRRRSFLFGSELKALRRHPAFEDEIDRGAVSLFLRHAYIPGPYSIYRGISKLTPGTILRLAEGASEPVINRYWSAAEVATAGAADPLDCSPEEAVDGLERILGQAVEGQLMSDVPLGAFLSGGIDSSAVVALMQARSARPVRTFSIGFHQKEYDEAHHARAVAEHLKTDHTELYVTADQAMDVIPLLPEIYDEPFADPSQIPTYLVSKLARQHVTVSLSGDAGDELFGGYNRYAMTDGLWRKLSLVPAPARKLLAGGLTALSPSSWNRIAGLAAPILPDRMNVRLPGDKIHKGAGVMGSRSAGELYHGLVSLWRDPQSVVRGGLEPATMLTGDRPALPGLNDVEKMMALDLVSYLPDDILVKVDRAAMAVSLETRVPMLDHRVVDYAWRLPLDYKIRGGQTKWVLRQLLYRHVPKALIERPKMGFGVPIGDWLRGPLRDWAENLLAPPRIGAGDMLDARPITDMWQGHLGGSVNEQYRLWAVLMLQSWFDRRGEDSAISHPTQGRAVA